MPTIEFQVRRFSVVTRKPFQQTLTDLTATVGRPDMKAFRDALVAARTPRELEDLIRDAIGPSELMEFVRYDSGEVLGKELKGGGPGLVRLLIGNPLIMKEMARTVPDAAAYAPVTILVDERADGVHVSYDTMESLIAVYGGASALAVARDLDAKIVGLMEAAAR